MIFLNNVKQIYSNFLFSSFDNPESKSYEVKKSNESSNESNEKSDIQKDLEKRMDTIESSLKFLSSYGKNLNSWVEKLKLQVEDNEDKNEIIKLQEKLNRLKELYWEYIQDWKLVREELNKLKSEVEDIQVWIDKAEFDLWIEHNSGKWENSKNKIDSEKLKTITNNEFLSLSVEERLQYVTKNNIDYSSIKNWNIDSVTFFFDQDWNWKDDSDLYKLTTLWQVLWQEIKSVICDWKIYSREWLKWEFFNWNKRLTIHTWTKVEINEVRELNDINKIEKSFVEKSDNFLKNKDIVLEAMKRWIDTWIVLDLFSKNLEKTNASERLVKLEELFTEVDRKRSRWNLDANSEELKNVIKDENNDWKIDSDKLWWTQIDINNIWKWNKWLLDFISVAEWTNWNYNALYWNWNQDKIDFTSMSLKDVMLYQKSYTDNWSFSSAIWKYQFIRKTLNEMISKYGIDPNDKFDEKMQDKLALLKAKEYWLDKYVAKNDFSWLTKNLSKVWASFPKDESNLSYYHNDWVNKAKFSFDSTVNSLEKFYS